MPGYGMTLTPELWQELSGDVVAIAARLGWSRGYCRKVAIDAGLLVPPKRTPPRIVRPYATRYEIKLALREHTSIKAAAQSLGMTRDQLRVAAKKVGVDLPGRYGK